MPTCTKCGASPANDAITCPVCGHGMPQVVTLIPAVAKAGAYPPSVIIAGLDKESGDYVIDVHDPETRSEARTTPDGTVRVSIKGVPNVGRRGERRLFKTLRQALAARGVAVAIGPGHDDRGEDGTITVGTDRFTLQAVTVPRDPALWRRVPSGVTKEANRSTTIEWLHDAISQKASQMSPMHRPRVVLTIDARHFGVLRDESVRTEYLERYGEPAVAFGFASIWIVGPTELLCERLGTGLP